MLSIAGCSTLLRMHMVGKISSKRGSLDCFDAGTPSIAGKCLQAA
jgi:hypothetical protein